MSEHTPGPWNVEKTDGYVVCELTAGWCVVATEADPNKYSPEADARLIAAAPDLLKALDEVTDFWYAGAEAPSPEELEPYIKLIARARGEQG